MVAFHRFNLQKKPPDVCPAACVLIDLVVLFYQAIEPAFGRGIEDVGGQVQVTTAIKIVGQERLPLADG